MSLVEDLATKTPDQCRAIAKMCMALRIREPLEERKMTQKEARLLMWELRKKLNRRKS